MIPAVELTRRQRQILRMLQTSMEDKGRPPSVREIGQAVGLTSTSSVAHQLRSLEDAGYIERGPGAREITITGPEGDLA